MRKITSVLVGGLLASVMMSSTAVAKPGLSEVKEIDDKMLLVGVALEISEQCSSISARKVRGVSFLWSVKNRANDLGYTDDEINAYRKSKAQKARIRARGEDYVKSKGLDPKSAADLCTLGKAEIASGSVIGSLLRAK